MSDLDLPKSRNQADSSDWSELVLITEASSSAELCAGPPGQGDR